MGLFGVREDAEQAFVDLLINDGDADLRMLGKHQRGIHEELRAGEEIRCIVANNWHQLTTPHGSDDLDSLLVITGSRVFATRKGRTLVSVDHSEFHHGLVKSEARGGYSGFATDAHFSSLDNLRYVAWLKAGDSETCVRFLHALGRPVR